ncbi:MAG: hypothetical protein ACMUIP_17240 [bacterium]
MNRWKNNIFFIILIYMILFNACEQIKAEVEQKDKGGTVTTNIKEQDSYKNIQEGDIFSKERWERIQKNLIYIKIGMKKYKVIEIIGFPDGIEYTPPNIMQYSVAYGIIGEKRPSASIHIILDENQKVAEMKSNAFIYGPPPHEMGKEE